MMREFEEQKFYQIVEISENFAHAGTKATADTAAIADALGFERLTVRMDTTKPGKWAKLMRQKGFARDYRKVMKTIPDGATVLLQHPFHYPQLTRERTLRGLKNRGCHFISVIHDVEELRKFRDSDYYRREFAFMQELTDVVIAHNEVMKEFLIEKGFSADQIVVLEIFDYLQGEVDAAKVDNAYGGSAKSEPKLFKRSITVAGNLDVTKCGYIGELYQVAQAGVNVNLFGPNYDAEKMQGEAEIAFCADESMTPGKLIYQGVFPADEIPSKLTEGFGLVWDGSSITGCVGDSGQYLRYNNPHKLSLYLSSGLPVVIWKDAAEASFVEQNGVGITISSLMELPAILKSMEALEYAAICERTASVGEKLRNGEYMRRAIQAAVTMIEDLL